MDIKDWVNIWKRNTPILQDLRRKELQNLETKPALITLLPAFEHARLKAQLRPSSGLVELQQYFLKAQKNGLT